MALEAARVPFRVETSARWPWRSRVRFPPRGSRWPTSSCRGCSFPNGASRVVRPAPLIESLVVLPFENLRLEQEYVVRASWGG
jgi:hypothetical protein